MSRKKRHEIRSEMKRILSNLDERWQRAASTQVCAQLTAMLEELADNKFHRVLAWTAFFDGEIDLSSFISSYLDQMEFYLPRSLPDRSMQYVSIGKDWAADSSAGEFGIPEPTLDSGHMYVEDGTEDTLVIVPGLAFDRHGNRIGRGKGYYDRFLGKSSMKGATVVGVCWNLQILEAVPVESHDMPMDWLCHEEGFVRTGLEFNEEF